MYGFTDACLIIVHLRSAKAEVLTEAELVNYVALHFTNIRLVNYIFWENLSQLFFGKFNFG